MTAPAIFPVVPPRAMQTVRKEQPRSRTTKAASEWFLTIGKPPELKNIYPEGRVSPRPFRDLSKLLNINIFSTSDVSPAFNLSNNYPNPFNPSTQIQYAVPRASNVSLVIYNVLGQQVRTLVDAPQNAGRFTVTWDGRDNLGHVVGSGVYFYRLNAGETSLVKKMLMLK